MCAFRGESLVVLGFGVVPSGWDMGDTEAAILADAAKANTHLTRLDFLRQYMRACVGRMLRTL